MWQTVLRSGIVASSILASWICGGLAYLLCARAVYGRAGEMADTGQLAASMMAVLVLAAPFLAAMVATCVSGPSSAVARIAKTVLFGALFATTSGAIVSALLGRGRVEDVMSVEGGLILAWVSASSLCFVVIGSGLHCLGLWGPTARDGVTQE